jgi:hypothetical protein
MNKLSKALLNTKDKRNCRTVLDSVIEKSGGWVRYIQLCKADDSVFIDAIDKRLKLEPKQIETTDNRIYVSFKGGVMLPRPETEQIAILTSSKADNIEDEDKSEDGIVNSYNSNNDNELSEEGAESEDKNP